MANEPPTYSMANAILREYQFNFDELEDGMDEARFDEDFDAIGLVACRDIGRNREILWFYGSSYPRPYTVGKQCNLQSASKRGGPIATLPIVHTPFRRSHQHSQVNSVFF